MSNYRSVFAETKVAAVPDARVEASMKTIESNLKDIRHHLTKGEKRPTDDIAKLFKEIASISESMARRVVSASTTMAEEDKEARFEEGKPADPTEHMSPADSKAWKREHDKHKDQFKAASKVLAWKVEAASADPSSVDQWFVQKGSTDIYFFCTEVQKNGRMKGPQVSFQGGKSKPTVSTLSVMNPQMWKQVPAKDVPEEYREAVKDKGHSKA